MAERIQVELVDDLDGSPAQSTVTFALDGVTYEIDLNERNAGQLRSILERYVKQARASKSTGTNTKQKEREERRVRQANKDLTEQIRGAAQRTKERRSQEVDAEQAADVPTESTESAEPLMDWGTSGSGAANHRAASQSGASQPAASQPAASQPAASQSGGAESDADVTAMSPDEADADRVPAVVMPQFSSAE